MFIECRECETETHVERIVQTLAERHFLCVPCATWLFHGDDDDETEVECTVCDETVKLADSTTCDGEPVCLECDASIIRLLQRERDAERPMRMGY